MAQALIPRRDTAAVGRLAEVARAVRPLVLARDRVLPLGGPLASAVPGGSVIRGSVVAVDGRPGEGVTSLVLGLAAAATGIGEWAAAIDAPATLGGLAAIEAGIVAERFVVVRRLPRARWAVVVAGLLEGVSVVIAATPPALGASDARRLAARARERGTVLVVTGVWPAEAGLRLSVETSGWSGLDAGSGWLGERLVDVRSEEHGIAAQAPVLARTG